MAAQIWAFCSHAKNGRFWCDLRSGGQTTEATCQAFANVESRRKIMLISQGILNYRHADITFLCKSKATVAVVESGRIPE